MVLLLYILYMRALYIPSGVKYAMYSDLLLSTDTEVSMASKEYAKNQMRGRSLYIIHEYMHKCLHTYIHKYIHACMHACMHTYGSNELVC
jgi:hypothetical protein